MGDAVVAILFRRALPPKARTPKRVVPYYTPAVRTVNHLKAFCPNFSGHPLSNMTTSDKGRGLTSQPFHSSVDDRMLIHSMLILFLLPKQVRQLYLLLQQEEQEDMEA